MTRAGSRLIVFAKAPEPGRTKTRLIPTLGAEGAAALHRTLVHHTLAQASRVRAAVLELHGTRTDDEFLRACARHYRAALLEQAPGDLGARMHAACAAALRDARFVVLIGSDCPALNADLIGQAFRALEQGHDAVHCPTEDGGYALVGLARSDARLFSGIAWSTASVMDETRERLRALAWRACELDMLWDVDRPEDYERLLASGLLDHEMGPGDAAQ